MLKKDINFKQGLAIALVLVIIRLVLANSQMMLVFPYSAPLDDDLYFAWAQSIVAGNWLGEYNYLTLSKYPFFGIYLALVHLTGIPVLVANAMLWVLLGAVTVWAFTPVVKTNLYKLALFAAVIYNPASYAEHTLRIYRDSIFPILCTLFFVSLAGWALRLKSKISHSTPFLVLAGLGLGLAWISREDGFWLLPFAVVAIAICIIYIVIDKQLKNKGVRIALTTIPAVITLIFVLTICNLNNKYYGVFTLSDFDDGAFAQCFGTMTSLSHKNWHPLVSVPEDVRIRMYEDCPSFKQFYQYLDAEDSAIRRGYRNSEIGDYKSGHLYWGMRRAAQELGIYETAKGAEEFWSQLAAEVEALRLADPDALPRRSSLTPPIRAEYIMPVIGEAVHSRWYVVTWQSMRSYEDTVSDIVTGGIDMWQDFLHEQANYAAVEYTDFPYYTPFQHFCFKVMNGITWIYRALTIPLLLAALFSIIRSFINFTKLTFHQQILSFVLLGMGFMGVFRIFIISFMEKAAFDIGTYAMYLGAVYPIVILICVLGLALLKQPAKEKEFVY